MLREKLIDKKLHKLVAQTCQVCGEPDPATLHNHRIIPGADEGRYVQSNVAVLCANCHSKVHLGNLKVVKWLNSTAGRLLLIERSGIEEIIDPMRFKYKTQES